MMKMRNARNDEKEAEERNAREVKYIVSYSVIVWLGKRSAREAIAEPG